jgi:ubiquinone biosynthesis protein COQ9
MTASPADWAAETEQQVLDAALALAPSEGWTPRMATMAGRACGLSADETDLLLPHGPQDLAALLSRRHDARALTLLAGLDPTAMKVRERIRAAVEARLDAAAADGRAVWRWTGFLALPWNAVLGARLAWESADVLWRWAGDTATDENHYSKRFLLAGILTGALAVRFAQDRDAALEFVDRRIADVMTFEKWKATTRLKPSKVAEQAAKAAAKARYR